MPDTIHIPEIVPLYQLREMVAFPYMLFTISPKEREPPPVQGGGQLQQPGGPVKGQAGTGMKAGGAEGSQYQR